MTIIAVYKFSRYVMFWIDNFQDFIVLQKYKANPDHYYVLRIN